MAAATTKVGKVKAKQAAVVTAGARPPNVRESDRARSAQRQADGDRHEPRGPPIDEGDLGRSYFPAKGEEVAADHEAVLDAPGAFAPVED